MEDDDMFSAIFSTPTTDVPAMPTEAASLGGTTADIPADIPAANSGAATGENAGINAINGSASGQTAFGAEQAAAAAATPPITAPSSNPAVKPDQYEIDKKKKNVQDQISKGFAALQAPLNDIKQKGQELINENDSPQNQPLIKPNDTMFNTIFNSNLKIPGL